MLLFLHENSDTPHHLKNKRVQVLDNAAASILLANAPKQSDYMPTTPDVISKQNDSRNDDGHNNQTENGEFFLEFIKITKEKQ